MDVQTTAADVIRERDDLARQLANYERDPPKLVAENLAMKTYLGLQILGSDTGDTVEFKQEDMQQALLRGVHLNVDLGAVNKFVAVVRN